MGVVKQLLRFSDQLQPHTWIMGKKAASKVDLGGQLFGAYDGVYNKPTDIAPAPDPTTDAQAYAARDQARRLAKLAMGQQSTVRTNPTAAPYTGTPTTLLGQ